jgi:hypothetical protein
MKRWFCLEQIAEPRPWRCLSEALRQQQNQGGRHRLMPQALGFFAFPNRPAIGLKSNRNQSATKKKQETK